MKRAIIILAAVILIVLIGLVAVINYASLSKNSDPKPFYVGVTFCGNNTQDAKLLIDRVKNYTNLFVLQSGPLMANETAVTEIGDYAVVNGLHFGAFFDTMSPPQQASWVGIAEQRWGSMFAGVYYGDEPGDEMLDGYVTLSQNIINQTTGNITATVVGGNIIKLAGGGVTAGDTTYFPNGIIKVQKLSGSTGIIIIKPGGDFQPSESNTTTYYPNGTITLEIGGDFFTTKNGTDRISQVEPYEEVLSKNPIPNCDAAAENFVGRNQKILQGFSNQWQLSNRSFPLFTADYGLYWWDYQSGYDLVLAELGWNNSAAQEIGLVRGAANLQDKSWGTIITWKYTQPPYLTSGDEMYDQMRTSYECGAEYVIIFNYAEDMNGPMERFRKNISVLLNASGTK